MGIQIRRAWRIALTAIAVFSTLGISAAPAGTPAPARTMQLTLSVDWEGRDLFEHNLAAMERFRAEFPSVRLVHYLNPVYWTKPGADPRAIRAKLKRVILPQDEVGLHLHAWRTLVERAGVEFRTEPKFWTDEFFPPTWTDDAGYEVPMWAYSEAEMRRMLRASLRIFADAGLPRPTAFRAGGWQAKAHTRAALAAEGFVSDSSAVAMDLVQYKLGHQDIFKWLTELSAGVGHTSQPFREATPHGDLWILPDNGGLADYTGAEKMLEIYRENLAVLSEPRILHFGFHQETAGRFLERLSQGLRKIYKQAARDGVRIQPIQSLPCERQLVSAG